MKTIELKSEKVLLEQLEQCKEYTDDFNALTKKVKGLNISFSIMGAIKSPWDDTTDLKLWSLLISVNINNDYVYNFYGSHQAAVFYDNELYKTYTVKDRYFHNFSVTDNIMGTQRNKKIKEIKAGILYSVLCDVNTSIQTPDYFQDFCDDFGYDPDSLKARNLHDKCMVHKRGLMRHFSEEDCNFLPY